MHVSHNEIVNICRKAFRGLNVPYGDAVIIANIIADSELIELNAIKDFIKALNYLKYDSYKPAEIKESETELKVNLHGGSILCYLANILAYAQSFLDTNNEVNLFIENCHNRSLAYGFLQRLANKGLSVKAQWSNKSSGKSTIYIINPQDKAPNIYFSLVDAKYIDSQNLEINIRKENITLPNSNLYDDYLDHKTLLIKKNNILEKGIYISQEDWDAIAKIAKLRLVPETDKSRLNAGGV
ncbi:DUF3726 domain-containing protein [Francisella sp. SYW-9]|uniref:DUF3726 domain-containing protein n=1 Tax=Francisella sp. SYW-9 TaxID=2610888 RepID=UPI00123D36AB|nr:DUF3726 domain-containing protein [Francisella sp. SYW-9]